jgi:hypothetical protein
VVLLGGFDVLEGKRGPIANLKGSLRRLTSFANLKGLAIFTIAVCLFGAIAIAGFFHVTGISVAFATNSKTQLLSQTQVSNDNSPSGSGHCPVYSKLPEIMDKEWRAAAPNLSDDAIWMIKTTLSLAGSQVTAVLPNSRIVCLYNSLAASQTPNVGVPVPLSDNFAWLRTGANQAAIGIRISPNKVQIYEVADNKATIWAIDGDFKTLRAKEIADSILVSGDRIHLVLPNRNLNKALAVTLSLKGGQSPKITQFELPAAASEIFLGFGNVLFFINECPAQFRLPLRPLRQFRCEKEVIDGSVGVFHVRRLRSWDSNAHKHGQAAIFLHGGPRGKTVARSRMSSTFLQQFDDIYFVEHAFSETARYPQDVTGLAFEASKQVSELWNKLSQPSTTTVLIAESLGARILDQVALTKSPLKIVLLSGALDGASKADALDASVLRSITPTVDTTPGLRTQDGRLAKEVDAAASFEIRWVVNAGVAEAADKQMMEFYRDTSKDPLAVLCARSAPTSITIIHSRDDKKVPTSVNWLNDQVSICQKPNLEIDLHLVDGSTHGGSRLLDQGTMKQ